MTDQTEIDTKNETAGGAPAQTDHSAAENLIIGDTVFKDTNGERTVRGIDAVFGVSLIVEIVLGRVRMPISELLALGQGSVIALSKVIGEPIDVVINDKVIAQGHLVRIADNRLGVNLTKIVSEVVKEI